MESKTDANEFFFFFTKQTQRMNLLSGVSVGRSDRWGVCNWRVHTAMFKMDNQQGPVYSTGNFAQYSVITYKWEKNLKNNRYIYITEPLCYIPETNTLLINYTSI